VEKPADKVGHVEFPQSVVLNRFPHKEFQDGKAGEGKEGKVGS
jgi:hypothetical protein